MWDLVSWPRIEPRPLALGAWILDTGPPRNSPPCSSNHNFLHITYSLVDIYVKFPNTFKSTFMHAKSLQSQLEMNMRAWQPTSVFLPRESQGQRSLAGYIQPTWLQRVGHNWVTDTFTFTSLKSRSINTSSSLSRLFRLFEVFCAAIHGVAEMDMTERLNWTELTDVFIFEIICSSFMKKCHWYFIEIALKLYSALYSVIILPILILPSNKHGIFSYLVVLFTITFIRNRITFYDNI